MTKQGPAGAPQESLTLRPVIYGTTQLPGGFQIPPPPARPICLVAVENELDIQLHGVVVPCDLPRKAVERDVDRFIAHARVKLKVGWETIEIYPLLGDEYWKPEYAATWAEGDLLATIAQRNLTTLMLTGLDNRGASRKKYAALLEQFDTLLAGPEEPVHQFLKRHPELVCPTNNGHWSKLKFGHTISDFVFREPHNDYLLVEIEAPIRKLFCRNGQQRAELTHAINQIADWIQYIANNRQKVEEELGLVGISTDPRSYVVIGRSASLSQSDREKLVTLQRQYPKLRIFTYDDLIASARANLERLFGPLTLKAQNAELYFWRQPLNAPTQGGVFWGFL
ncbi:MAG: DUF4263 domain-containing protein [Planctomycetia bacterium]|nr:DUF4263 domain-containing protein [Planctomycetia bacterium]